MPFRPLPRQQSRQVEDESEVEKNDPGGERSWVTHVVAELPRQVEGGGDNSKPLGPVFASPQPVAFCEPNQGVGKAQADKLARMRVGGSGYRLNEQPRVMSLRVDSMPQQERISDRVEVGVPQGKQPADGGQRQKAFGALEERNGSQTHWQVARLFVSRFQSSNSFDYPNSRAALFLSPRLATNLAARYAELIQQL
jgi:hypothetical protein